MNRFKTQSTLSQVLSWSQQEILDAEFSLLNQIPLFDIELVSTCNIRCHFCPRERLDRSQRFMTEETFQALLDFLPERSSVMFSGLGEPTLHPTLAEKVHLLKARKIPTAMISNAILLTPKLQEQLFQSKIDEIQISLHGLTENDLTKVIIRGAKPARVLKNLDYLAQHRPSELRVRINFVETKNNMEARQRVQKFAEERGFSFFWRREHSRAGHLKSQEISFKGCGIFSGVTFITVEGDILSCVNDLQKQSLLGNIRHLTWSDVLQWKLNILKKNHWFPQCSSCNDDYRWILLWQGQLDEV